MMYLHPKPPFDFYYSLDYVRRSEKEIVESVEGRQYRRLLELDHGLVLVGVKEEGRVNSPKLRVDILNGDPGKGGIEQVGKVVGRIFGMELDLTPFYEVVSSDRVMNKITNNFYGMKPVLSATVFEALVWGIIGQQININFAYDLKGRLVRQFGESLVYEGTTYYSFPSPEKLATVKYNELTPLQFSQRKAEYIIDLARSIVAGEVDVEERFEGNPEQLLDRLTKLRGIGRWTVEYALMKGYGYLDSIPAADIGLKNAVGRYYGFKRQATEEEVRQTSVFWTGYRSLASFYLWKQLETDYGDDKRKKQRVFWSSLDSPLGTVYVASTSKGVCNISFGRGGEDGFRTWLHKYFTPKNIVESEEENREVIGQLSQYFAGERRQFDLPLDLIGTPFQQRVWQRLLDIPYGETISYGELAKGVKDQKLSRAVGVANSKNPVGIVVPCHRVIGKDGSLVGFAGGVEYKEQLLALESKSTL